MILLLLWAICPISLADFNINELAKENTFLHKTPSVSLQKLFTVGPHEREVQLDFNVDNSEEDPHSEVRRSAPEVRISEFGDKTIPLDELEQTTAMTTGNQSDARFDLPVYDFMVPAGKQANSTLLAMVIYKTKFEEKPTFRVVMDRLKWFEMGEPKITKAGDVQEYEIPILLLPGADVRPELTKNSVYKFGIEAQEGENVASSRVRVEVFSFSPTTKRVKTTTTAEETTTVEMTTVGTTTTTVTTEAIVEVTTAKATGKAASNEQVETAVQTSESSTAREDTVEMTTTSEAATAKATTESEAAGLPTGEEDTAVEAKEMATESAATHKDPAAKATGTEDTRMGQETEKEKNVMVETTTAESVVDGAAASATEVGATTSAAVDATATAEPTATATEGTTTTEPASETSTASEVEVESSGLLEIAGATMSETKKTTAGTTTGTTAKPTPPSDNVEGSGRSVEIAENISDEKEEEDDDNPLTEVVTMPTPIVQEAPALKVNISGLDDSGVFTIKDPLGRGDLLRGLVISAARNTKSNRFLSLAVDRPELFSIRPSFIESGGRAYLFANHPGFTGDVKVKVTASDGPISEEKTFVVKNVGKKAMNTVKREMFSLTEDAPSGTVVGRAGEGWKIAGKPGLFALVGQDIILSCPSEAPCLDYESQHAHYLLLISKTDPSLASEVVIQISDVNDNPPSIEATDAVIRVSDGELIMPFAVQIVDPDSPSVQENELRTNGPAAEFLALEKVDADLYQVAVKGPSSPGRYDLLLEVSDRNQKSHKKIRVLVQNSHSHAHFRRGRYERSVTPERLRPGAEVTRVELEGIPIDEAKFVLLKGNPGWLTVDDYGGTVTFTRPTRTPSSGVYEATVVAIGRETGRILAQTVVSVTIVGPPEVKKVFKKSIYERTIDRESSPEISISLETPPGTVLSLDKSSLFAIDENGQKEVLSIDDVTISGDTVTFSKDIVSSLRVLRLEVTSGEERAVVVVHLTSSPSFLEHRRRMASRPQFPAMPTVIEIAEELPVGHIVAVLPAVHPETGDTVESTVEGAEGAFELEKRTGALKIAKRLDFDDPRVPKEYNLKISAGDDGYETTVLLKIRVMDEDDNPPVIQREGLAVKVVMPENLPLDTIISRLTVTDRDEISLHDGLTVALSGLSSSLFHSTIANGTITIKVAGTLDRENISQHPLLVTVSDPAGHTDSVAITVFLGDVNDNAPKFLKEIYNVQAVENWPAGLVLETIKAIDEDSQERGMVTYSLESLNSKYFSLNSTSGELFISRDLMGLAREEPYLLTAVAVDGGNPPLNTTVPIRITVSEPRKPNVPVLNFLTPPPGHVLQLKGDLKENEKVYQAKARVEGDARNVKYSIEELATSAQSPFGIDELSGEIIVFKAPSRPSNHVPAGNKSGRGRRVSRPTPPENGGCMDRLEKRLRRLIPRRWRRRGVGEDGRGGSAEELVVERLREVVLVKNLRGIAASTANLTAPSTPPPPELVQESLILRENRSSFRRRREDTWHGPSDLPFIDCDAVEIDIPSPLGTSTASVASSLPQLTRQGPERGSRESGYLSALSLSPQSLSPTSFERLTPKALRIKQTSQEAVNMKIRRQPEPKEELQRRKFESSPALSSDDDVEKFMRGWVYKTKYVTTVFEARNGGLGEIVDDAAEEIRRWLEKRRMLVAACELHFSVPQEKRCRRDEQRLKTTLLAALRDNNQRILNLRRGRTLAPIQLVESRTEEKIDREDGCIQGVYLRAYGRLLRYSHWETPAWHSPYWQLPTASSQPRPGSFLWDGSSASTTDDTNQLKSTAVVAVNLLLITARHLHSGATATRLLRAHFTPSSRFSPVFPEGAPLYYQFRKGADIGKISAEVEDEGPIFYYLIPSCSPSSALFTLNSSSGQLFHSGPEVPKGPRVELCVLASTTPLKETANLIYNPKRSDMVTVVVASGQEEETLPDLSHLNNTVTTIDRHLSSVGIRLFEEVKQSYNFSIEHIDFTPSESVLPLTTAAPLPSLFSVDRRGVVRAAPGIVSQPSGVYSVNVEAKTEMGDNKKLVQEFHLVPPTARLRFVFDKPLIPVAKEFRFFKRDLQDTISKTEDPLRFVVDQPKQYVYNTSRSSACFHVIGAHSLLSPHSTIGALSKVGDLFQVYNNFSVVDIETTCEEPKIVELPMAAALASPTVLLLVSVLAFAILLFFLICVYFCFVRRYRDYLRAKEKAMKGPPQPVPATPTFVLTPPMGSSSPRMASLGYWEG